MYCVLTVRRFALGQGDQAPPGGTGHLSRFAGDQRGGVALMFGLMLGVTVVLIGASVDIGRWMLARKQTQEAIDSANLAGLRVYQDTNDTTKALAAAKANYDYSVAQSKRGTPATNNLLVSDNITFVMTSTTSITATGGAVIKMPFLGLVPKILNLKTLPLLKTDGTENAVAVMAVGSNSGQSLEVAMMIDNTGSMQESIGGNQTKMEVVIAAANSLVDKVVWADQSVYTSKVAIAPFTEAVNMGTTALANTMHGAPANNQNNSNCVVERTGSEAFTETSPIGHPFGIYPYGNGGACGNLAVFHPLTAVKDTLHTLINSMSPNNSTSGHLGTAWAWYALSPNFNSVWTSAASAARPYSDLTTLNVHGQPILKKIAILMTDGQYNSHYCNFGGSNLSQVSDPSHNSSCGNGPSSNQALALCTNMKNKGIEVFTIGAGMTGQTAAQTLLQNCATDVSHYYDASDTSKLYAAFDDITKKLVKPFVSH